MKKNKCPCCGYRTIDGEYDICPVCFWENDPYQNEEYSDVSSGANSVSLNTARENYKKFGACEERFAENVRDPLEEELV